MLSRTQAKQLKQSTKTPAKSRAERTSRVANEQLVIVLGKILTATAITGATNRWLYTWRKANVDGTASTPDYAFEDSNDLALTGNALNANEGGNTATRLMPGITLSYLPTGFVVQPVEGYVLLTPKRLKDGTTMWFFDKPNAIDGECP